MMKNRREEDLRRRLGRNISYLENLHKTAVERVDIPKDAITHDPVFAVPAEVVAYLTDIVLMYLKEPNYYRLTKEEVIAVHTWYIRQYESGWVSEKDEALANYLENFIKD